MLGETEKLILATQRIAQLEADLRRVRGQLEEISAKAAAVREEVSWRATFPDSHRILLGIGGLRKLVAAIPLALESTGAQSDTERREEK